MTRARELIQVFLLVQTTPHSHTHHNMLIPVPKTAYTVHVVQICSLSLFGSLLSWFHTPPMPPSHYPQTNPCIPLVHNHTPPSIMSKNIRTLPFCPQTHSCSTFILFIHQHMPFSHNQQRQDRCNCFSALSALSHRVQDRNCQFDNHTPTPAENHVCNPPAGITLLLTLIQPQAQALAQAQAQNQAGNGACRHLFDGK